MNYTSHIKQQGAVLIVGLIMMLLLTIIGLAAVRGTDLQERMAGNMRDRNLAFQSAEAALRIGEEELDGALTANFNGGSVGYWPDLNKSETFASLNAGTWPQIDGTTLRRLRPTTWTDEQWEANTLQVTDDTLKGIYEQPRYAIEEVIVEGGVSLQGGGADFQSLASAEDAQYYRITSRGLGGTADAEVVLQSTFIRN